MLFLLKVDLDIIYKCQGILNNVILEIQAN